MSRHLNVIDQHLDAYVDPEPARRRDALARIWSAEGHLIDPPLAARGHAEIDRQAAALQSQFPGHRFVRSSGIDEHHSVARYGWRLLDPAGAAVLEGIDFAQFDADGRLLSVAGFFGPLPPPEGDGSGAATGSATASGSAEAGSRAASRPDA